MGKLVKIALILLSFLCLYIGKANAAVLTSKFIIDKVKKSVVEQVSENTKGKIVAEINGIPYKEIEVPDGKVEIISSLNAKHFNPQTLAKVDIVVDGKKVKTFGVPVKLYAYDQVWITTDTINRGESFSNSNLSLENKELGLITENAARQNNQVIGCLSKKGYKPGEIIDSRFIESVPAVIKNSPISLIFKSSEITITLAAQSLDSGKMGDYIRVRSKQYKKDYIGKVIGINTVLVNI